MFNPYLTNFSSFLLGRPFYDESMVAHDDTVNPACSNGNYKINCVQETKCKMLTCNVRTKSKMAIKPSILILVA